MPAPLSVLVLAALAACAPRPVAVVAPTELAPAPVFVPARPRRVVTSTSIEIYEPITFDGNTAEITPASRPTLDQMAALLQRDPSLLLIEVRGHSDWEPRDHARRAELALERAHRVIAELVARGVAAGRLVEYGAADTELLSTTDPVINRRVEFRILERAD